MIVHTFASFPPENKKSENTYKNVLAEPIYFLTYLFFVYAVDIQTNVHINVLFLNLFYVKITLFNKDKMLEKVLKIKDFYTFLRCSNTTHSTCLSLSKLIFKSSSMIGSLKVIDFSHCPFGCFSS